MSQAVATRSLRPLRAGEQLMSPNDVAAAYRIGRTAVRDDIRAGSLPVLTRPGRGGQRASWIHPDDAARLYLVGQ